MDYSSLLIILLFLGNNVRLSVGQSGIIIVPPASGIISPSIVNSNCQCVPVVNCADGAGSIDPRVINNPGQLTCGLGQTFCCNIINPTVVTPATGCGTQALIPFPSFVPTVGQASFSEYPWMVVVLGTDNSYVGGAVLIDSTTVLTAAHKVNSLTVPLKVRLGDYILNSDTEPYRSVEIGVVATRVNTAFIASNLQNDIAILKLASPVDLVNNPHIRTICLPTLGQSFAGQRCYVSGYGASSFVNGVYSQVLREVDVPILDGPTCQTRMQATRLGPAFVLNQQSFVCAGGENGKDACTGDGGSPMACLVGSQWFLAGLVSWGIGCGSNGVPGAYVNIPQFINWIAANRF